MVIQCSDGYEQPIGLFRSCNAADTYVNNKNLQLETDPNYFTNVEIHFVVKTVPILR